MAGGILYANQVAGSITLSGATVAAGMPLANLLDPQPRMRARLTGASGYIVADLLASAAIDVVAVICSNLTSGATYRVRLSTADATGAAGDAWDTGTLSAETDADCNGNIIALRSAGTATGRYLRLDLADGSLATIDLGLVVAGALWRLQRAHAYGIDEGRLMLDRRDRNQLTGAEFPAPAIRNPRYASFRLPVLSSAEARGAHRQLVARLGSAREALWLPDLGLTQAELNARSLWGAVNMPGEAAGSVQERVNVWSRSVRLVERL